MKTYLIIGVDEYIGRFLADRLLFNNNTVIGMAREAKPFNFLKKPNYYTELIYSSDYNNFSQIVESVDYIIYASHGLSPKETECQPEIQCSGQIALLTNFLNSIIKSRRQKLVFISSAGTIYSDKVSKKQSPSIRIQPINHYGLIKEYMEKIILYYYRKYCIHMLFFENQIFMVPKFWESETIALLI